jgi:hypothetical protein
VLNESSLDHIKKSTEYWEKMAREPHREIQEKWARCEKNWVKINKEMKDIRLPEFGTPDDFGDLRDSQIAHRRRLNMGRRTRKGDRHNARSGATVYGTLDQSLGYAATVKCQSGQVSGTCGRDQRYLRGPMEQHRFPYSNTCEELFIQWSEYKKSHPFKMIS